MSQHMDFKDMSRGYQAAYSAEQRENDPAYGDRFGNASGQKLNQQQAYVFSNVGAGPATGQRLALAIVSVCLFVPLIALMIPLTLMLGPFFAISAIAIVSAAITIVNVVFNRAR